MPGGGVHRQRFPFPDKWGHDMAECSWYSVVIVLDVVECPRNFKITI